MTVTRLPSVGELEGSVVLFFPETLHFDHPGQTFLAIFPTLLEDVAAPPEQGASTAAALQPSYQRAHRRSGKPRAGRRGRGHRAAEGNSEEAAEWKAEGPRSDDAPVDVSSLYTREGATAACLAIRASSAGRRRHVEALRGCAIDLVGEACGNSVMCTIVDVMPDEHLVRFLATEVQEGLVAAAKRPSSETFVLALLERQQAWPAGFETRVADAVAPLVRPNQPGRILAMLKKCLQLQPATRVLSSRVALACCGFVDVFAGSDGFGLLETSLQCGHVAVARSLVASLVAVRRLANDAAGSRLLIAAAEMAEDIREELLRQVQRLPTEQQLSLPAQLRDALCWRAADGAGARSKK